MYGYMTVNDIQMKYANNEGLMNDCVVAVYSNRLGDNMYLDFGTREGKQLYLKIMGIAEPLVADIVKTATDGFAKGNTFKIAIDNKYAKKANDAHVKKRTAQYYDAIDLYNSIYKKDGISEYLCSGLFRVLCSYGLVGLAGDVLSVAIELGRANNAQHEYENDIHLLDRVINASYDVNSFYTCLNSFSGNVKNTILFPYEYLADQILPLINKYTDNNNANQQYQQVVGGNQMMYDQTANMNQGMYDQSMNMSQDMNMNQQQYVQNDPYVQGDVPVVPDNSGNNGMYQ